MSSEEKNLAAVEAFWQAYNAERLDDAADMYSLDAHLRQFTHGIDVSGREEIRDLMKKTLARFPGRRSDVVHTFATGDVVVAENHWEALTAESGERLTLDLCYIFRF